MDDVLEKIVETEKVSSREIDSMTDKFKSDIESLRNELENGKTEQIKDIINSNKEKKDEALKEVRETVNKDLELIREEKEKLLQNKELCNSIKREIITTLLSNK